MFTISLHDWTVPDISRGKPPMLPCQSYDINGKSKGPSHISKNSCISPIFQWHLPSNMANYEPTQCFRQFSTHQPTSPDVKTWLEVTTEGADSFELDFGLNTKVL